MNGFLLTLIDFINGNGGSKVLNKIDQVQPGSIIMRVNTSNNIYSEPKEGIYYPIDIVINIDHDRQLVCMCRFHSDEVWRIEQNTDQSDPTLNKNRYYSEIQIEYLKGSLYTGPDILNNLPFSIRMGATRSLREISRRLGGGT